MALTMFQLIHKTTCFLSLGRIAQQYRHNKIQQIIQTVKISQIIVVNQNVSLNGLTLRISFAATSLPSQLATVGQVANVNTNLQNLQQKHFVFANEPDVQATFEHNMLASLSEIIRSKLNRPAIFARHSVLSIIDDLNNTIIPNNNDNNTVRITPRSTIFKTLYKKRD
ncbi:10590_t:CDS:2 [Paraglomus brasilianum]|uniref:10590_t:CDS:1 n=1 Tax=Paraglomus brasilianum TaxID=144538 RepID=A0A9N8ZRP8_9GLOM|nr:10590_t:CDS:2 [Paraglomus brasilianum]